MKKIITVKGMTCEHCEKSVYNALSKINSVDSIDINLETGKVAVVYNEDLVTLEQLKETVENQGYDVEH